MSIQAICLSIVLFLWGHIYRLFVCLWGYVYKLFVRKRTTEETLPLDVIEEICSRLPAQSVRSLCSLTRSPHFVNMHLRRATPVIAFQYVSMTVYNEQQAIWTVDIHFSNEEAPQKIVQKTIRIGLLNTSSSECSMPFFVGSYNGLLLFRSGFNHSVLHVHNPVTEEEISVSAGNSTYRPCGFFFHPRSKEYKALFVCAENGRFKFMEHSLQTKLTRVFASFSSHPPDLFRNPTIFNGALHWMVDDDEYLRVFGVCPGCSNSIVVFDIEREEFCTLSHPGDHCEELDMHLGMRLMEMEGHLCYCGVSECEIVLWALEEYEERIWVKRWVVPILPMHMKCDVSFRSVYPIHIYGSELLLRPNRSDLFLYNLTSGTFRRVGYEPAEHSSDDFLLAFAHVNTLVTIGGRVG